MSVCLHFLKKYTAYLLTFGSSLEGFVKAKGYSGRIGPGSTGL